MPQKSGRRPDYDTKRGITASLAAYDSFYRLAKERLKAFRQRKEPLMEFCILGQIVLGGNGLPYRLVRILDQSAASVGLPPMPLYCGPYVDGDEDHYPSMPEAVRSRMGLVVDKAEMERLIEPYGPDYGLRYLPLPPPRVNCSHCRKPFRIRDIARSRALETDNNLVDLTKFAGQTVRQVQELSDRSTEAEMVLAKEIWSQRWVGGGGEKSPVEIDGWRNDLPGSDPLITDGYVIQEGDRGIVLVVRYYHGRCWQEAHPGVQAGTDGLDSACGAGGCCFDGSSCSSCAGGDRAAAETKALAPEPHPETLPQASKKRKNRRKKRSRSSRRDCRHCNRNPNKARKKPEFI